MTTMTVPETLLALAADVRAKRRILGDRYEALCKLNDELRERGGVAFTSPDPDGMCWSFRAHPRHMPAARGVCRAADRERTTPPGSAIVPVELAQRLEETHSAWHRAANAAEKARLDYDASGHAFLDTVLETEAQVAGG